MKNLPNLLQEKDIPYELINHDQPILTAQEGAEYFGIEVGQTAPTLILKTDQGYYALIFSGQRGRVDLVEVARILGVEKVKLAKPKEVQQVTGFAVGSVSMVEHGLPCVMDQQLYQYPFVYGGTGQATCTLKITPDDLGKLNQVVAMLE